MEFVLVHFAEEREVIIDDVNSGQKTNKVIEIEAGTHSFSLTGTRDFIPLEQFFTVVNTSVLNPREVRFEKKA
jgi:hypothetical protein